MSAQDLFNAINAYPKDTLDKKDIEFIFNMIKSNGTKTSKTKTTTTKTVEEKPKVNLRVAYSAFIKGKKGPDYSKAVEQWNKMSKEEKEEFASGKTDDKVSNDETTITLDDIDQAINDITNE